MFACRCRVPQACVLSFVDVCTIRRHGTARHLTFLPFSCSVCRSALKDMEGGHFDADSAACVTTLIKIVDNVVHRKDDARTRQIRCANAAFDLKVT